MEKSKDGEFILLNLFFLEGGVSGVEYDGGEDGGDGGQRLESLKVLLLVDGYDLEVKQGYVFLNSEDIIFSQTISSAAYLNQYSNCPDSGMLGIRMQRLSVIASLQF